MFKIIEYGISCVAYVQDERLKLKTKIFLLTSKVQFFSGWIWARGRDQHRCAFLAPFSKMLCREL